MRCIWILEVIDFGVVEIEVVSFFKITDAIMIIPVEMCKRPCSRIVTVWYAQCDVFEHLEIVEMLAYWSDISFGCCSTAGRLVLKGVLDTQWIQWHVPWERANVHGISLPGQWWVFFIPFRTIAPSRYCKLRVCGYALASMLFCQSHFISFCQRRITLKWHLLVSSCFSFDCCLVLG